MNINEILMQYPNRPYRSLPREAALLATTEPMVGTTIANIIQAGQKNQFMDIQWLRDFRIIGVTEKTTLDVPGFRLPVLVRAERSDYIAVDLRNCTRLDPNTREIVIHKQHIYNFSILRAQLQILFLADPALLENYNLLPGRVFVSLIKSVLERSRQLSREEAQIVKNLAANFWHSMFLPQDTSVNDERFMANHLMKVCQLANTTGELYKMYHDGEPITTLHQLCDVMKQVINTPKIKLVTPELLISLISNTHMDHDYAFNAAIGIQYPPVFIALVQGALLNTTKSTFSMIVKQEMMLYRQGRVAAKDLARIVTE